MNFDGDEPLDTAEERLSAWGSELIELDGKDITGGDELPKVRG
jgi:hypothetical protein